MKRTQPKRIIFALIIGLVCTLLSLLYEKQRTIEIFNHCNGGSSRSITDSANQSCAAWYSQTYEVMARGFPFDITQTVINGSTTEINVPGAVGNYAIYSVISFTVLLFWRPKAKVA